MILLFKCVERNLESPASLQTEGPQLRLKEYEKLQGATL